MAKEPDSTFSPLFPLTYVTQLGLFGEGGSFVIIDIDFFQLELVLENVFKFIDPFHRQMIKLKKKIECTLTSCVGEFLMSWKFGRVG